MKANATTCIVGGKGLLLLAMLSAVGCAPLSVKEKPALESIQSELRQASEQSAQAAKAKPLPAAVAAALAPQAEVKLDVAPMAPIEPRFDLAVNNAPAQQVFLGIATGSRYSMLLAPEVSGNITVSLKDVTVPEAMSAIRELYGYDYRIESNRIFVQPLTVQTHFYSIPYPTSVRKGASELRVTSGSIADSVSGASGSGSSSATGGGSSRLDSSRVSTENRSDFWTELKDSVGLLIGCTAGACPQDRNVMISPHTGMLAVRATPKEQRQVSEYLKRARLAVERQVMIEAKILEVSLNEGAQSGINWAFFNHGSSLSKGSNTNVLTSPKPTTAPATTLGEFIGSGLAGAGGATAGGTTNAGVFGLALQTTNFMALLNFLETQGGVQVLSSPRIAAINNQKAVLKVGTDEFFVTGVTSNTTTSGTSTTSSPSVTVQPFFSGIALDVTPQIDDQGNIILHVHPSVSSVTTSNKDIDLGAQGLYRLPLAASSVSETDSIVRLQDGEIAAIGGLMSRASLDTKSGVPGLSNIPGLGTLFRNDAQSRSKRELVILLKPTIIRQSSDWADSLNEARGRLQ
jgi:MSHA biogenesis protein MshL